MRATEEMIAAGVNAMLATGPWLMTPDEARYLVAKALEAALAATDTLAQHRREHLTLAEQAETLRKARELLTGVRKSKIGALANGRLIGVTRNIESALDLLDAVIESAERPA